MNTNAYRMFLAGAGLAAAWALAGCDAGEEPQPYAEEQTEPAADPTYAARDDAQSTDPAAMRTSPQEPATAMEDPSSMTGTGQLAEADVVGQSVVSQDGEEIGTVVQVVESDTGMGQLAIIEVGEFLGIGEKQVAIELSRLSLGADGQVRTDVTEDRLQEMPEYEDADATGETQGQEGQEMAEQGTE